MTSKIKKLVLNKPIEGNQIKRQNKSSKQKLSQTKNVLQQHQQNQRMMMQTNQVSGRRGRSTR